MHLLIYCAGGFGMEVMDMARRLNAIHERWDSIAFADDACKETTYGAAVYRLEEAIKRFGSSGMEVAIANGEPFLRQALRQKVERAGIPLATIVDSTAVVSETCRLGSGTIVFAGCFLSSAASIGRNVAIIAGALIGHQASIADNCVIAGHANLGGGCIVGSETYIGMGTQVRNNVKIGRASIIGMGSVVYNDIPDEIIALGNPCRPMKPNVNKRVFF